MVSVWAESATRLLQSTLPYLVCDKISYLCMPIAVCVCVHLHVYVCGTIVCVCVCVYISGGGGEEEEGKRRRGNRSPHTLESLFLSHDIITFTNIGYYMRLVAIAIE